MNIFPPALIGETKKRFLHWFLSRDSLSLFLKLLLFRDGVSLKLPTLPQFQCAFAFEFVCGNWPLSLSFSG